MLQAGHKIFKNKGYNFRNTDNIAQIDMQVTFKARECQTQSYFHRFDGRFGDGDHLRPRDRGLGVHQRE